MRAPAAGLTPPVEALAQAVCGPQHAGCWPEVLQCATARMSLRKRRPSMRTIPDIFFSRSGSITATQNPSGQSKPSQPPTLRPMEQNAAPNGNPSMGRPRSKRSSFYGLDHHHRGEKISAYHRSRRAESLGVCWTTLGNISQMGVEHGRGIDTELLANTESRQIMSRGERWSHLGRLWWGFNEYRLSGLNFHVI